jgi:hypothetical protein
MDLFVFFLAPDHWPLAPQREIGLVKAGHFWFIPPSGRLAGSAPFLNRAITTAE